MPASNRGTIAGLAVLLLMWMLLGAPEARDARQTGTAVASVWSGVYTTEQAAAGEKIQVPTEVGGANWPGSSFDPETAFLYIHSQSDGAELLAYALP